VICFKIGLLSPDSTSISESPSPKSQVIKGVRSEILVEKLVNERSQRRGDGEVNWAQNKAQSRVWHIQHTTRISQNNSLTNKNVKKQFCIRKI
jgi:hypothetical protein